MSNAPTPDRSLPAHPVVELRRYRLHHGRRDELVELFDRELVETQEDTGIQVVGQFRDLDRPDHFVWLRAFPSIAVRRPALEAFYGGPVWARHGLAAVSTIVDSDDVLLLHPLTPRWALRLPPTRADAGARADAPRVSREVLAVVLDRPPGGRPEIEAAVTSVLAPALAATGARTLGLYETDHSENDYPALPVRDTDAIVWFGTAGATGRPSRDGAGAPGEEWARALDGLGRLSGGPLTVARLAPTPRSRLDGTDPG